MSSSQILQSNATPMPDFSVAQAVRSRLLLLSLLVMACLLRLWNAAYRYLNADEALHYLLSVQTSVGAAYRASLTTVHPPLLILFLYYWGKMGHSELFLRLPSLVAGMLFCWVMFAWLRCVSNDSTALLAFALLLFSPALIQLSSEVRQYGFLLLFCASALYFLDRAVQKESVRMMLFSTIVLYLALLTHYSSLIFALTMGIYALIRLLAVRPRAIWIGAWVAGQLGALALIRFLFVTHISKLRSLNAMEGLISSYLRRSVLEAGANPLRFIARSNLRLFHYFFSQGAVGAVALALFIVSLVLLIREGNRARTARLPSSSQLAFLLIFALALNCGLALFRVYPYGGTRHDSYLAIFVFPGIAIALARWKLNHRWWKPTAIAAILAICNLFPSPEGEYLRARDQSQAIMAQAVTMLKSLPEDSVIFTDDQGGLLLSYYLCDSKVVQIEQASFQPFFKAPCGRYSVISLDPNRWTFQSDTFPETLASVQRTFNLSPGTALWFFQAGWFIDKEFSLHNELKQFGCSAPATFGHNIFYCQITLR
jgi:uncharacterized membrane protein